MCLAIPILKLYKDISMTIIGQDSRLHLGLKQVSLHAFILNGNNNRMFLMNLGLNKVVVFFGVLDQGLRIMRLSEYQLLLWYASFRTKVVKGTRIRLEV